MFFGGTTAKKHCFMFELHWYGRSVMDGPSPTPHRRAMFTDNDWSCLHFTVHPDQSVLAEIHNICGATSRTLRHRFMDNISSKLQPRPQTTPGRCLPNHLANFTLSPTLNSQNSNIPAFNPTNITLYIQDSVETTPQCQATNITKGTPRNQPLD